MFSPFGIVLGNTSDTIGIYFYRMGDQMYRPGTISKLIVIFFFTFAVLAPHHVEAATRASLLTDLKDFLKEDWQQTKEDFAAMGGFLARDWKRTKEDFRVISQKLSALESKLRSGAEINLSIRPFREKLLEHIAGTIDEMGPKAFCKAIEETTGKEMFSEKLKNADPQLARAALLNNLDKCFVQLAKQSKEQKAHTLLSHMDDAKMVLRAIKAG